MPLPASGKWTRPNATLRPRELTIDSRQNPKVSVAALSPDGRLQNLPICEVWSKKASPSALQTPFSRRYSGSTRFWLRRFLWSPAFEGSALITDVAAFTHVIRR
jgi:hypothetical protein